MIQYDVFSSKIMPFTLLFEGGYSNQALDKGGETYRGISRKFNPKWSGWSAVDRYPNKRNNTIIAQLETDVKLFYYANYFKIYNLHLLNNVNIALAIFDFVVHSGMKNAQPALLNAINNVFGTNLKSFNIDSINVLNTLNSTKLLPTIAEAREKFIAKILVSNPSQQVFSTGWKSRLAKIRTILGLPSMDLSLPAITKNKYMPYILGVIVLMAIVIFYVIYNKNRKEV